MSEKEEIINVIARQVSSILTRYGIARTSNPILSSCGGGLFEGEFSCESKPEPIVFSGNYLWGVICGLDSYIINELMVNQQRLLPDYRSVE